MGDSDGDITEQGVPVAPTPSNHQCRACWLLPADSTRSPEWNPSPAETTPMLPTSLAAKLGLLYSPISTATKWPDMNESIGKALALL